MLNRARPPRPRLIRTLNPGPLRPPAPAAAPSASSRAHRLALRALPARLTSTLRAPPLDPARAQPPVAPAPAAPPAAAHSLAWRPRPIPTATLRRMAPRPAPARWERAALRAPPRAAPT